MKSVKLGMTKDIPVIARIMTDLEIMILAFFSHPVASLKKGIYSKMSNAHKICTG